MGGRVLTMLVLDITWRVMPATYPTRVIDAANVPHADEAGYQHLLDVYASEINKTASGWQWLDPGSRPCRPYGKSSRCGGALQQETVGWGPCVGAPIGLPRPSPLPL